MRSTRPHPASFAPALALAALLSAAPASAQVRLPNGLIVPRDSMNGETQLFTMFAERQDGVDWIADASPRPDVFSPLCGFTATFLLKESQSSLALGWYNVIPGATTAPTTNQIYTIVPAGSPVGTMITGTSIRDDPRYMGGQIGFALIRTPPHYTEARWNRVCNAGACANTPGPWILSLTYPSVSTPNAFYVAFEDGDTSSSSWDNDGDYNDYVYFFTGLTCQGGGEPCEVEGAQGICASGMTECAPGGAIACRQVDQPRDERCDGADSDCDGAVDEGDGLCPALEVCLGGRCVASCFEGGCGDGEVCSDEGRCIDAACIDVECPAGERCVGGECGDACEGIVCPGDHTCVGGRCIDLCAGVACDDGVCERGVCVVACTCRACGAGLECAEESGECVSEGCADVTCPGGMICRAGQCVDRCAGAVCPDGQRCQAGACRDIPAGETDAGMQDGGGPLDGGSSGIDGATGVVDAGSGGGGGGDSGCSCRVGRSRSRGGMWLGALGLLVLVLRRRR